MESFFIAATVAYFAWSVTTQILLHRQVSRCNELLAARSYGEYAAGKSKLTNPKPAEQIDPGF